MRFYFFTRKGDGCFLVSVSGILRSQRFTFSKRGCLVLGFVLAAIVLAAPFENAKAPIVFEVASSEGWRDVGALRVSPAVVKLRLILSRIS